MREAYDILQDAITDCGYWRWWTGKLPDSFQIEFGGVQLYQRPSKPSSPPSSVFAFRFEEPEAIEFLDFGPDVEADWFARLHRDEFEAPTLCRETFLLGDGDSSESIRGQAVRTHVHYAGTRASSSVALVFKATRGVGLFVAGKRLRLLSHTGEIMLESVARLHGDWWDYWKRYWDLKGTPNELPKDYACEVCIPAGD